MIPKHAYFFWSSGVPMSPLRFLTLASFRRLHPDWKITLAISHQGQWQPWQTRERQDWMSTVETFCDWPKYCKDYGVELCTAPPDETLGIAPNHVSDMVRWDLLRAGGWYFDMDIMFVRPLDNWLLGSDFVVGCFVAGNKQSDYVPCMPWSTEVLSYVGVIGAESRSPYVAIIRDEVRRRYCPSHYDCIGPEILRVLGDKLSDTTRRTGSKIQFPHHDYFYPVWRSDDVGQIWSGEFQPSDDTIGIHWYGGHPKTQEYMAGYRDMATAPDSISRLARELGIDIGGYLCSAS